MSGRRSRGSSQRGCITKFFKLFNTSPTPPAIPNQTASKEYELSFTADKTPVMICSQKVQKNVAEVKQQMATESSTTSISSSCSSTFSSVKFNKNIFQKTKSPNFPVSQTESSTYREARVISVRKEDGKGQAMKHIDSPRPLDPSRYSCDGTVYSLKSTVTIKDLPRLSLDSKRSNNFLLENEPESNKRPSGVVARLMGLEAFPETTFQYQESLTRNSRSGNQSRQKISSFYGETERRIREESLSNVKTAENIYGQKYKASRLESEKVQEQNGIVLLSPAAKKSSPPRRNLTDKKAVAKTQKKPKRASEKPASVRRTSGTVSGTKLQHKKIGVEKQEHQKFQSSHSRKETKQPCKQRMETRPPTRKVKPKSFDVISRNLSNYSDSASVQSEISINSDPTDKIFDAGLNDDDKSTVEQPSPVSVLDATFYGEGSLSPVKKISNTIHDHECGNSIEEEWDEADTDRFRINTRPILCSKLNKQLVNKLTLSNPSDHVALYSTNPDYRYINKILLASGFLQDSSTNQLHPPGCHLIDANLFHILEKTERDTRHADDGQTRNRSTMSKSNTKNTRMLLFDSVNEIIGHKFASSSSSIFSKNMERIRLNGEKLLEEVWSEIVKLQGWGECKVDEDEDYGLRKILSTDTTNQNDWTRFSAEFSGLVLDVERLIFRDLIREIINDGSANRQQRRHCKQLFDM